MRAKKGELTEAQAKVLRVSYDLLKEERLPVRTALIASRIGADPGGIAGKLDALERKGHVRRLNIRNDKDHGWSVVEVRLPSGEIASATQQIAYDDVFCVYRFHADLNRLRKRLVARCCLRCGEMFSAYGRFNFLCGPCGIAAAADLPADEVGADEYVSVPQAMISRRRAGFVAKFGKGKV